MGCRLGHMEPRILYRFHVEKKPPNQNSHSGLTDEDSERLASNRQRQGEMSFVYPKVRALPSSLGSICQRPETGAQSTP